MQQLDARHTYTPRNIPHVPGNCGMPLKVLMGRDGASCLKTASNNPDAATTLKGGQSLRVFVINMRGEPLMPCSPAKARRLLKEGKAEVARRTPFTIRLKIPTGESAQDITLGVDSGFKHIGLSAVTADRELYSADVRLRDDIVKLNSERRMYRHSRRNRKTWYRAARFLNRKKNEGWLAPSIQHKLDSHLKLIDQIGKILPLTKIRIEVAAFDIQKIKNPDVSGTGYQNGEQTGFWNVREYVLYRDGHSCRHCKGKSKDPVLEVHHIESRQTGGNRPENLLTLCSTCHEKVSQGKIALKVKPSKGFRAETFMSMVRWKLVNMLRDMGIAVEHTYGYITKSLRIEHGLEKSHANDAFVIAGGNGQERTGGFVMRQVRKCNRKLFKGDHSHIRNTAPRLVHGFRRFDKVMWQGTECFIFGRRLRGYFDLRKLDGTRVNKDANVKQMTLLERAGTILIERRPAFLPIP